MRGFTASMGVRFYGLSEFQKDVEYVHDFKLINCEVNVDFNSKLDFYNDRL